MRPLGDLEAAVMDVLWAADGSRSVRAVRDALAGERPLAYTTVMTVLDNLHRKGWLTREMATRAWQYRPSRSREAAGAELMREALTDSGNRNATLVAFLEQLTPDEASQLAAALEVGRRTPDRPGS